MRFCTHSKIQFQKEINKINAFYEYKRKFGRIIMDFMIKKAKERLIRETNEFIHQYGEFNLESYNLNNDTINDYNKIPNLVQLGIDIMEFIYAHFKEGHRNWEYHFVGHANIMKEQVKILKPIAKKIMESEEMDISEILNQIPIPKILPDGVDYRKYEDIFNQLKLPSIMFHFIFVCENILRKFIIQVLDDNGYPSIDSIGHRSLSLTIEKQKKKEDKQNYLPIRGDHDIYYLDLIHLSKIITYENIWKKCFDGKVKTQTWICERIESLHSIRNRVAHSSGYLTNDELKSVETYSREIIKQINQYII